MGWSASSLKFLNLCIDLSGKFLQKGLDRDTWDNLRKGHDYQEKAPEVSPSEISIPDASGAFSAIQVIGIAAIAIALIALLIWIISSIRKKSRNKENRDLEANEPEEIHNVLTPLEELWKAFEDAKRRKDYREAVRLLYQIVLKNLNETGQLVADPDKTNREYILELGTSPLAQRFAKLTLFHEYSWYGGASLPEDDFGRIEPVFLEFIKSESRGK